LSHIQESTSAKSFNVSVTEFLDSRDDAQYIDFIDIDSMLSSTCHSSITLELNQSEKVSHMQFSQSLNEFVMLLEL